MIGLPSMLARRNLRRTSPPNRSVRCGLEAMEPRWLLSLQPIVAGAVYVEEDLGSDMQGDHFYVTFNGGAPGTQLQRIVIDGDQNQVGFAVGDVFFDTNSDNSEPGEGRFGADDSYDVTVVSNDGIDRVTPIYRDGSTVIEFVFEGFDAGERFEFTVDVDEVEDYDPAETDVQRINDGFDPITSGVEFQGSTFVADFVAPDFEPAVAQTAFVNRYDELLSPTELQLPADGEQGKRDRTAGAVAETLQQVIPASLSGHVYHDANMNGVRDVDASGSAEQGIAGVRMQAIPVDSLLDQAVRTALTDSQGRYQFDNLVPGVYRVVQLEQPAGFYDWLDRAGTVDGVPSGLALNPGDEIEQIELSGGSQGDDYDFGEILPVSIEGRVQLATPDGDCFGESADHRPVVGSVVQLLNAEGEIVAETVTDNDGRYRFAEHPPGEYQVRQITPDHLIDGAAQAGVVAGQSRGTVIGGSHVAEISLSSGEAIQQVDFCELEPVSISGRVQFATPDGDCFGDSVDHAPVAGVVVRLLDEQGAIVAETTTNAAGRYGFDQLPPGVYSVFEVTPEGLFDGGAQAGTVDGETRGEIDGTDWIRQIQLGSGEVLVDADFCELQPVSIRGQVVRSSIDGDCFGDEQTHTPIADVVVELRDESGRTVAQTRTDELGNYEFTELEPGTYSLFEITPDGYFDGGARVGTIDGAIDSLTQIVDASQLSGLLLGPGQVAEQYDFCEHAPSSVSGFVYHDRNNDGIRDVASEEAIAGVTLQLVDDSETVIAETMTGADGRYQFEGLEAGEYELVEVQPSGWLDGLDSAGFVDDQPVGTAVNPGDSIGQIIIGWGQAGTLYNFGERQTGAIFGDVHLSTIDGDCFSEDRQHEPLSDVLVQLLDATGSVVQETTTDALGRYQFLDLQPGKYGVREVTPSGLIDGGAQSGVASDLSLAGQPQGVVQNASTVVEIDLRSGLQITDIEFCNHEPSELSGNVYFDRDNDGQRAVEESGIEGAVVILVDADNVEVARTTSDAAGNYRFEGIHAGVYHVVQQQPTGWLDGIDSAGTVDGLPSGNAVNPGDRIEAISVGWGQVAVEYNFGELLPASLAGIVHTDLNADCLFQESEKPLSGIEIQLLDDSGAVVARQTTDSAGRFVFLDVLPGRYELREITPEGFRYFQGGQRVGTGSGDASVTDVISDILVGAGDQLLDYAFCEVPPSAISGIVFQDGPPIQLEFNQSLPEDITELRDGRLTEDDRRLAGVVLELRNGLDGTPVTSDLALPGIYADGPITTTTDANGYYLFDGLRKGNYAVYQIQPEGYIDGIDTSGTIPAIAINRFDFDDLAPAVMDSLTTDPNFDAIVRIALPPGQFSQNNNFSEILTERPITIPFDNPLPAPIPPMNVIRWVSMPVVNRPLEPLPWSLTPYGRIRGITAHTWHLSVIDGGSPRGNGTTVPTSGPFWFGDDNDYVVSWDSPDQTALVWQMWVDGQPNRERQFGIANGIPIAGDFNGDGLTEVGVFHEGQWFIDINGNGRWDDGDLWAKLGFRDDQPVVGDWDGDGKDDIGIFGRAWPGDPRAVRRDPGLPDVQNTARGQQKNMPARPDEAAPGRRELRVSEDGRTRSDVIDHVFHYGTHGDQAIAGDWNGDGISNIGIYHKGLWHLDTNGDGEFTDEDRELQFGREGDIPIAGDFNGDGVDEIGILRGGRVILDVNRNYRIDAGDQVMNLRGRFVEANQPNAALRPVVGDWNGDGKDDVAVTTGAAIPISQESSELRFVEVDAR